MTNWPARTPDLCSKDFFFWQHLKSMVHATQGTRQRISQQYRNLIPFPFQNCKCKERIFRHLGGTSGGVIPANIFEDFTNN